MKREEPLVSVIILTRNRPQLVGRAVQSAREQTLKEIEIIVVVDGPDEASLTVLHEIKDPRLRVTVLPSSVGVAAARNEGVTHARARWVAFLDDDDQWMPTKLETQLRTAEQLRHRFPIVSCRFIARTDTGDFLWPRRLPRANEHLSEYLMCYSTLFSGEGMIMSSAIFTARELLERVPFKNDLMKHTDFDWLLRASRRVDVTIEFVPTLEPLVIWNIEESRPRVTNTIHWSTSLAWIRANRDLVTDRAYASFVMTGVSRAAARAGDWRAFWLLLWELRRAGNPGIMSLLVHLSSWLVPDQVRERVAVWLKGTRNDKSKKENAGRVAVH
jgi:glycosyltransferase involved in cell wall biosynthesis